VGRDGVSSRIQRRNPHALRLQSFVYVCRADGRPRLRGEWIGMEGNKFIFFLVVNYLRLCRLDMEM
jgi:hypothetical protein